MTLQGKITVVTGGTTGIGRAAAERLLREGATVIITGKDGARLAQTERELSEFGRASVVALDAEDAEGPARVAAHVRAAHGRLDIVFANAGVTWPAPLGQITAADAQRQFLVNATAPLLLVQALLPLMGSGGSVILNTSCLNELGMPGMAVYSASKAALRSLTRTLAAEVKDRGIRVNAISPARPRPDLRQARPDRRPALRHGRRPCRTAPPRPLRQG
jgi:NAD(P)-dependent dehydrogenase (short-subunit alcohol dehydrogenase family)